MLLSAENFQPISVEREVSVDGDAVAMRLYAGLVRVRGEDEDTDDPERFRGESDAGWYLFCNERLLVAHDRSRLTGWGEVVAAFHPQFRQFRGYVFLTGAAEHMPWTTTKTAVDEDSSVFRQIQTEMFDALQKAHVVMNRLKTERQQLPAEERPATLAMELAQRKPLSAISSSARFVIPPAPPKRPSGVKWIRYSVDPEDFDRVAAEVGTEAPADVGRETFRFYLETQVPE